MGLGIGRGGGRELVGADAVEERSGRNEEQASGDRSAEVEDAVVVAGRPSNEHVLEHLLDGARRTAVADEIGSEFPVPGAAEGHVVTEDLDLPAVLLDDGEGVVRTGGLDGIVELDVGDLRATDDLLLGLGGEAVPGIEVVKVLLDDDVASARKGGVLLADQDGVRSRLSRGILGPVHEAEEIAIVEVAEAVDLVGRGDGAPQAGHDQRGELEAQVHALGADVEEQVAASGNRVARAGSELAERMQLGRTRRSEEAVPGAGTEAEDAGEGAFEVAKSDGAKERGEIRAERENTTATLVGGIHRDDKEDGGASQWRG